MKRHSGFGLTEILISLFLSSLIITSLIQLYFSVKRHYFISEQIIAEQLEMQWVSDLLSDSIRRAGFTPCLNINSLITTDTRHLSHSVKGIKWGAAHEQYLQLNRMSDVFTEQVQFKNTTELLLVNRLAVNTHRPLIIADCQHAEIHQILNTKKTTTGQRITLAAPMRYSYEQSVFVGEWIEEQWMVKPNHHGINSLYYRSLQTEELSPLIHSLSVSDETIAGTQFIKIQLGLDGDKTHELMIRIRSS